MANQYTSSRPETLAGATDSAVYSAIATSDEISDAWRAVTGQLEAVEAYAGSERPTTDQTQAAERAVERLPALISEYEQVVAAKAEVLRRRVAKLSGG